MLYIEIAWYSTHVWVQYGYMVHIGWYFTQHIIINIINYYYNIK